MKQLNFKWMILLATAFFTIKNAAGQANASLNILTLNSGQVALGGTVDIQVSVGNTGPGNIGVNKVRAQINVPTAIVSMLASGLQTGLPAGWIITANTGGSITVCNGTDVIAAGEQRQVFIKIQGNAIGGPSTVNGSLSFGPGTGVCTGLGSLPGDNTADNTSTSSIEVIAAPACGLSVSASAGTIACNGGTTTLTATPAGAVGTIEYSLNGGAFQAGNTFTVNAVGSPYTVTAREVSTPTCTATSSPVVVTEPTAITATAAAGSIVCNGGTTTLTATASGGTGTLEYSLNGGAFQASNTFTVNAAGSPYTITVRDANLCTATTNIVTVTEPTAITASAAAGTIACNGGTTTLTVTASGGTGTLEYSLNGGAFQSGNTFIVNAAGSPYTVTVRDANLCTATTNSVTVTQPTAITASAAAGTIACFGGTTTLTVTASGGTAPLQYSLNGGAFQSGNTFIVNAAGSPYTVTVRDANLCTATTNSVTVTQPAVLSATATSTPVTTIGGSDGTATAIPAGGTSPYTYSWNSTPVQTTITATGLTAGAYTVTVTDANGCSTTANTTVGSPSCALSVTAAAGTIACNGGTTTLTATASGAGGAVEYSLNGGAFQASNTFTVNAAGSPYIVTAREISAPTCTATSNTVTVTQPTAITASGAAGTIACNGGTTTLTVTASGGTGTLEYSLNGGAFQSGNTFTVNAAGSPYTVTVRDANLCTTTTNSVTVTQPTAITASAAAGTIACFSGTTTLTVTASGGTGTLEYSLNGGAFQASNTFTVNAAGSPYTVTVRDANLCTATTNSVTVTQPTAITASSAAGTIACFGGTTTLTVTASGGTAPLQYSLNGGAFQSGNTFTVNAAGSPYTVTVRDANLCTATTNSVTVIQPTVLSATATSTPVTTIGGSDGTATAIPAGGTSPYTYSWNSTPVQTTITATGLTAGSYTVTVTDANGCSTTANTTVGSPSCALSVTAAAGTIACNGGTTTLTATASGAAGAVEYSLNGGAFQSGNTFTVNAAGSPYIITAREVSSPTCTATSNTVTVTQPTVLVASSSAPPIALPGASTTVTVSAAGGTPAYTGTGTFTRTAGTYTFTVTDANGCTSNTDITLTDPTPGPANALINILTLNSGQVGVGGTVDVQVSIGNTGPGFIGVNKVRAQVNVPTAIAGVLPSAQQTGLPPGWIITTNTGGSITVCNGTDNIPAGEQRQVFIKVGGTAVGGPSTINATLSFGPGTGVCTGLGSLPGDNTSDNTSTSSIEVVAVLPVTLTDFDARLVNCQPVLHWVTESEINSDRFEIERSTPGNSTWTSIGVVTARGNSSDKLEYNFTDRNVPASSEQVLYRLKMIDRDGRYKYSRVIRVFVNCRATMVNVYPNPVEDGRLYVSVTGVDKNTQATLVSLSGQVLLKTKMNIGTNALNVSKVAAGVYILTVVNEQGFDKKYKVFIQH